MDGVLGLQGWQWLYIIEGIPAILLGLLTPILMTDRPRDAKWLDADEREWLATTMDAELAAKSKSGKHNFLAGLKDKRTLVYSALYFGLVCGIYGLGLWLPTIVAALGQVLHRRGRLHRLRSLRHRRGLRLLLEQARRQDRKARLAHRRQHGPGRRGAPGRRLPPPGQPCPGLIALTVSAMGIYGAIAPFLSMPSAALTGAAAASGLALVNSLGNLGGFVAPYAVGLLKDATGNNQSGLLFLSFCLCVTAVATYLYARRRPEGDAALEPAVTASPDVRTAKVPSDEPHEGITAMSSTTPFPAERTVVLTGAASARGIGRAAADRMASEGWSIAILDINAEDAKAAAAEIGSNRAVKAIGVGADVSDQSSVDRAITEDRGIAAADRRRWPTWPASAPRRRSWKPRSRNGTRSSPSTCAARSSSPSGCSRA